MAESIPRPPAGLEAAGRRLWRALWGELAADWTFDRREVELLRAACTSADHIDALEAVIAAEGVMSTGSKGQVTTHPAVVELRQQKLALQRLLGSLELVDPALARGRATPASQRARRAAASRWGAVA